jgi:DNA end-binding protein Ku
MAPRANWKGFLRLSLVTCPVALYPATSDSEKISFNQINRNTGHRIKYLKVDADTGEEVASEDIMKGYKVDTDSYIEVTKDELENIALDSNRTIDIDEFVPKSGIDPRYLIRLTIWCQTARLAMTRSPSSAKQSAAWIWLPLGGWC